MGKICFVPVDVVMEADGMPKFNKFINDFFSHFFGVWISFVQKEVFLKIRERKTCSEL
jgi:hypothetical protein